MDVGASYGVLLDVGKKVGVLMREKITRTEMIKSG